MSGVLVLQAGVDGLVMGSVYALVAAGLTLVFGVMRVVNFAHGDFLMVAMYLALTTITHLGLSPYVAVIYTVPALFALGVLVFWLVIRPTLGGPETNQLLATLALGIVLQNIATMIFTSNPRSIQVTTVSAPILIGSAALTYPRLLAFVLAAIGTAVLYALLYHTNLGRMLRAASQNRAAAELMGINVGRMYMLAMGVGLACLGVAGPVLMPMMYTSPDVGISFTLIAFIVVVLGGLGSFGGALVGGLIMGLVESMGQALLPGSYGQIPPYLLFILLLLIRPEGLFGVKVR